MSSNIYLSRVANERTPANGEPAIEAVLQKLADDDRQVILAALERAERTEAELRYLADHDSLTGLLDRRRFRGELDQYVSFSARYGGLGAVMIIDIDGLKGVNDALGHHAGDNLIRQVAEVMRERVRATDIVARLSGDEVAILMPQTGVEGAMQPGEDLRAQVAENARPISDAEAATISVGITMFGAGEKGSGSEAVLVAADQAMYQAKEGGRNQIALFRDPDEPHREPERRQTTAARIRDALTEDRLSLHSQPIRSLASGGVERYELLLRMTNDSGELLPAASFIQAAEPWARSRNSAGGVLAKASDFLASASDRGRRFRCT